MKVNVKIINGKGSLISVAESTTIYELKQLIAKEMGIDVPKQRLLFKGKPIKEDATISTCGIRNEDKITLSIKDVGSESIATQPDLNSLLLKFLLNHFNDGDAQLVHQQFLKTLTKQIDSLTLEDIENVATINLQRTFAKS